MDISYYNWKGHEVSCDKCGWKGKASECYEDWTEAYLILECPNCPERVTVVHYPTAAETREAAQNGNKEAVFNKRWEEAKAEYWKHFEEVRLKSPRELPAIEGKYLEFAWDITDDCSENLILHNGEVIWRKPATWESWPRFNEVRDILKARYRRRFVRLVPAKGSENYLYGDAIFVNYDNKDGRIR